MPGMFSALQKGASYVSGAAGFGAAAAAGRGGFMGGAARYGLQGIGMAAGAMAGSRAGMMTGLGMMGGGMYGAMSDNTSILGGMAMGAAAGRYGGAMAGGAARGFRAGANQSMWHGGRGRIGGAIAGAGRSSFRRASADASHAARFFGAHLRGNQAVGGAGAAARGPIPQPASSMAGRRMIGPMGDPGGLAAQINRGAREGVSSTIGMGPRQAGAFLRG